jgi:hypothetical protein
MREKYPLTTRVISFSSYLEIIVSLEEHYQGMKLLTDHKLFRPQGMKRFLPSKKRSFFYVKFLSTIDYIIFVL